MRRKDKLEDDGHEAGQAPPPTASAMITPLDIQQKEFQVSRLGGYRMRDVDEFLDQLTDAMTAVLAENQRLRGGDSGSPIVGSADLDEVNRQADEIIQRARDEAARIVAEAERRAASAAGGPEAGSVKAEGREAVDAFLENERAFLQSLAALVQEHADGVKAMAREVRRRAAAPEDAAPASGGSTAAPSRGDASAVAATGSAPSPPAPTRSAATGPRTEPEPTRPITPVPDAEQDEPIVVSEPAPARARRPDDATDGGEDGDESLRELFWGEEG